jgi:hypothetical protein
MNIKAAAIVVGLVAVGATLLASEVQARKPAPKRAHVASKEDTDPLSAPPIFSQEAVGWRLIEDPATGARLGLPQKLVPRVSATRAGNRWSSAQGQIQVETFRLSEAALPALFDDEKKIAHRQIASSSLKPDSFVIAGVQGLKNFLVRAEARGSEVRGITIVYDLATEGTMRYVAAAVANAFSGFPDPNAAPPPGLRRMVEYGSAIVVGGDGYLITSARMVDECQSVSVPPLGHAVRLAEDTTNDLALLRLYGGRNLASAMLADDSAQAGELKLVGIADPLAQSGGAEATSVVIHVSGASIEPVPKPGFAGAAAVDARGRVVGMADVKAPAVADAVVNLVGTLVPSEAIRAFLQAHNVALAVAATPTSIEQSVVRVICVRK